MEANVSASQLVQQLERKHGSVHLLHTCPLSSKRNSPPSGKAKARSKRGHLQGTYLSVLSHCQYHVLIILVSLAFSTDPDTNVTGYSECSLKKPFSGCRTKERKRERNKICAE